MIFCEIVLFVIWILFCTFKFKKWHCRKKKCTFRVIAEVVDVKVKKPKRGSDLVYKPIFKIMLPGQDFLCQGAKYSNLFIPKLGEQYVLLLNPNDFQEFLYENESLNIGKRLDMIICFLIPVMMVLLLLADVYC